MSIYVPSNPVTSELGCLLTCEPLDVIKDSTSVFEACLDC